LLTLGDVMAGGQNPTVRRRVLAIELRRLRDTSGLSLEQAAAAIDISPSKLSRIETAKVSPSLLDVRALLEQYEVAQEQRGELLQAARDARQRGWWRNYSDVLLPSTSAYLGLESAAELLRTYEALLVPGLLQTEAYTRKVIPALNPRLRPDEVERWIELRKTRQRRLAQDGSPRIWAIVDEAALRRPVSGWQVMSRQLQHLVEETARQTVTLQVLPFSAGEHAGMHGSFTILSFQASALSDVVFLESPVREVLLEKEDELGLYALAFERLHELALDPVASAVWLTELVEGR
jgi:transcriptional regulator with XRE-family HTH domain